MLPTHSNSFLNHASCNCDQISTYLQGGSASVAGAATLVSAFYYNSPINTALAAFVTLTTGLGLYYNIRYRQIAPIGETTKTLNENAHTVAMTAVRIDQVSDKVVENARALADEDANEQEELNLLRRERRERNKELQTLQQQTTDLQIVNVQVNKEKEELLQHIEKMHKALEQWDIEIEKFKSQNREYCDSVQQINIKIDRFEEESKEALKAENEWNQKFLNLINAFRSTRILLETMLERMKAEKTTLEKLNQLNYLVETRMNEGERIEKRIQMTKQQLEELEAQKDAQMNQLTTLVSDLKGVNQAENLALNSHLERLDRILDRLKDPRS